MADGIQAYYDGFHQYADGVKNLNEGAQTLADSLTQLYDNEQTLLTGINTLRDGLSAVSGSVSSGTGTANKETQAKLSEALTPAITDYGTTLVTDVCSDAELQAALGTLTPEQQKVLLSTLQSALGKAAANDTPAFAGTVAATTSELLMQSMPGNFAQLLAGLDQLAQGTDAYMKAVGQVSQGASTLADGSAQLNDASAELYGGLTELHDGAAALRDGVQEFSKKAGKELGDDFGDGLQNVVRRLKAVQQAGKVYQTITGLADGMTGNVKFIVAVRDKGLRAGKVLCQRETRRRELLDKGVYLFLHFSHRDALFRVWLCSGREDTVQLGQHRPRRGNGIGRIDLCGFQFLCQILRELPVSCQRFFSQQKPQQDADRIHVCRRGQTKWLAAAGTGDPLPERPSVCADGGWLAGGTCCTV